MNQPNEEPMLTNDTSEKTEVLSKFFSSVFISEPNGEIPIISINCTNKFHNINITEEMVLNKLQNLNTSKSPGPDAIHPRVLEELKTVSQSL